MTDGGYWRERAEKAEAKLAAAPPGDLVGATRTAPCRVYDNAGTQVTHLVRQTDTGTPGDTLCGLSRFDSDDKPADLPGWSIGGGVFGPNVEQVDCQACADAALASAERPESEEA